MKHLFGYLFVSVALMGTSAVVTTSCTKEQLAEVKTVTKAVIDADDAACVVLNAALDYAAIKTACNLVQKYGPEAENILNMLIGQERARQALARRAAEAHPAPTPACPPASPPPVSSAPQSAPVVDAGTPDARHR